MKRPADQRYGLLWFWLSFFALDLIINFTGLVLIDPLKNYFFLPLIFVTVAVVVGELVIFVLIAYRNKYTKWVVLGISALAYATSLIYLINDTITLYHATPAGTGNFTAALFDQILLPEIIDILKYALPVLYFFKSRRAKTVLSHEFSHAKLVQSDQYFLPRTWGFWRNIVIYFMVFSIAGHTFEWVYCMALRIFDPAQYNPDSSVFTSFILRPFFVYGTGAVACVLLLYPLKMLIARRVDNSPVAFAISFVANTIACTSIELIMGLIQNQPDANGERPLWDYSDLPFNFMGQICLQNAIAFGVISTLFVWVIYPFLENCFVMIGPQRMVWVTPALIGTLVTLLILFGFDKPDLTEFVSDIAET